MGRNYSRVQIGKKDDTSFRTIPQRREGNLKIMVNESMDEHDEEGKSWGMRNNQQNKFSEEIDLNKKKIADL